MAHIAMPTEVVEHAALHGNVIAFDCETTGLNAFRCTPTLYTISSGEGANMKCAAIIPSQIAHDFLRTIFRDPTIKIVMHNSSYDCKIVHRFICRFRDIRAYVADTMVYAWLVDNRGAPKFGKRFSLKSLSQKDLHYKMVTLDEIFKKSPLAQKRLELEKRAKHLKKHWERFAKRHHQRRLAARREMRNYLLKRIADEAAAKTISKKDAAEARQKARAHVQDFDNAFETVHKPKVLKATERLLARYLREHTDLTAKIRKTFIAYALDDAVCTLRLYWKYRKFIIGRGMGHWCRVEMDNRMFATDMEITGVEIDTERIARLEELFTPEIELLEQQAYTLLGAAAKEKNLPTDAEGKVHFNLGSAKEVSFALHQIIGTFPPGFIKMEEAAQSIKDRAKDPNSKPYYAVNKRVLMYTAHPLARTIEQWRALTKLRSTYTKKLKIARGRLHAFFRSTGTDTGRYSCVAAWTPVLTRDGYKRIDQVRVGDLVWTHKQRWMPVTRTIVKGVDAMFDLHLSNGNILTCTTDHKVLLSDNVTWKPVRELIDECKQTVGYAAAKRGQSLAVVPLHRTADHDGNFRKAYDLAPQRHVGVETPFGQRDLQGPQSNSVLTIEDGQQEPNDRQNRNNAPQLERCVRRRTRIPDHAGERKARVCSPARDGASVGVTRTAGSAHSAPHRREPAEQRAGQPSAVHVSRPQNYPQLAGRDGVTTIEKINYRDRLEVYDLTVEEDHSYLACDTYQHNSSGPNLQNIPSRSKLGKQIREAFKAREGYKLIVADFSQIELRVAAIVCNDPVLLQTYSQYRDMPDGGRDYTVGDIHQTTQDKLSSISPVPIDRPLAKICNFALLYGMSVTTFIISFMLDKVLGEAAHKAFFDTYTGISETIEELGDLWRFHGIRSWRIPFSGRTRTWDRYQFEKNEVLYDENGDKLEVHVSKGNILNTLVQGSAADILKKAVAMFRNCVMTNPAYADVYPLMQVHDELVIEVREDIALEVATLLKFCMEYAHFKTAIPILADVKIVDRWSEGKDGERPVFEGAPYASPIVMTPKLDKKTGQPELKDGKPVMVPKMEKVHPELNETLHYLDINVREWCRQTIFGEKKEPEQLIPFTNYVAEKGAA